MVMRGSRNMSELIDAHLAHLSASGYADTTVTKAGLFLRRLDRDLPCGLEHAVEEEIVAWLNRERRSAQTRASYIGHIHRCLRWASDSRRTSGPRLSYNASAGIPSPRVR